MRQEAARDSLVPHKVYARVSHESSGTCLFQIQWAEVSRPQNLEPSTPAFWDIQNELLMAFTPSVGSASPRRDVAEVAGMSVGVEGCFGNLWQGF